MHTLEQRWHDARTALMESLIRQFGHARVARHEYSEREYDITTRMADREEKATRADWTKYKRFR